MIRIFYFTVLLLLPLSTVASTFYAVELAVHKNKKVLNKKLSKFTQALRKTIVIEKSKKLYKAKTLLTQNKNLLTVLLPAYKKVFPDAFVYDLPSPDDIEVTERKEEAPQETNATQTLSAFYKAVQDQTFYLCPKFDGTENKKFLIKVAFTKDTVTYTPILGKMPPMDALYKVEDDKLFLYQKGLLNTKVFSLLEKSYFKYHLFSSWVGDKKIKSLRYYFNLNDAKTYLNHH